MVILCGDAYQVQYCRCNIVPDTYEMTLAGQLLRFSTDTPGQTYWSIGLDERLLEQFVEKSQFHRLESIHRQVFMPVTNNVYEGVNVVIVAIVIGARSLHCLSCSPECDRVRRYYGCLWKLCHIRINYGISSANDQRSCTSPSTRISDNYHLS